MNTLLEEILPQAQRVVSETSQFVLDNFGSLTSKQINTKSDWQDVVTHVDKEAEALLKKGLSQIMPEASFYGEESGKTDSDSDWTWIVDPIDGTKYFARNLSFFSVTAALAHKDEPMLGIINQPAMKQSFYAIKDGGVFQNDQKLETNHQLKLEKIRIYIDLDSFHTLPEDEKEWVERSIMKLVSSTNRIRVFSAGAIAATFVSAGAIDAFIDLTGYNPIWDMVAPRILMTESGCKEEFLDLGPGPQKYLAAPPNVFEDIVDLLKS